MPSHIDISRITTTIALIIAILTMIVFPAGFFSIKYQNITGKVDAEAEITARLVAGLIAENPELWRQKTYQLDELLSRRPRHGSSEIRQFIELNGNIIAANGTQLPLPTVLHDEPVIDGGKTVARLRIITSIQPLAIQTFLMFLLSISLGAALFVVLRVLPFKAILKAEQALVDSNEFLAKVMENDTNGILVVTPEERILLVNQALVSMCGYERADLLAFSSFLTLVPENEKERIRSQVRELVLKHTPSFTFETSITRPDGTCRDFSGGAASIIKGDNVDAIVISLEDITSRKESEARIRQMAYFDNLTNLPNRALFNNEIEHAIAYAKRYHTSFGLMLIDIDNFKRVNDTLGHGYGDLLLKNVAERLVQCVRKSDYLSRPASEGTSEVVARLGGDEFTILLTSFNHEEDAAKVAKRVLDKTALPYQLDEHEVFVTLSIGIATYPGDGSTLDILFRNADAAMYHAKSLGKNTFQFYQASMNEAAMYRLTLENHLFKAIEKNELQLYYQPQVSLNTGNIVGVEALLRWQNPELGIVMPLDFISIAEENGLIIPITDWVIAEACRQNKAWQDEGLCPIRVAVNISSQVFKQRDLPEMVAMALENTQLDASLLEVEITESLMLNNVDEIIKVLKKIREMGVKISIDDFGTGYSSFSYLKQLPVHTIKIDRSFVKDLPNNAEDIAIVKAIIATAHSLGLGLIAEGVETKAQREFLSWHNCDDFQGYLFSKPLCAADMRELLARNGYSGTAV